MFYVHFVWEKLKGKRLVAILGLLVSAAAAAMVSLNPTLSKILVDDVIRGGETDRLIPVLLMMCLVMLLRTGMHFLRIALMEKASQHLLLNLRREIFWGIEKQEMDFFDTMRSGDIITRATGDLEYLRHFVAWVAYQTLDTVVLFVTAVLSLLAVSVKLTLMMLSVLPLILLVSYIYSRTVRPRYQRIRESLSDLNIAASENIAGNREVKAFVREDYEERKFYDKSREYYAANVSANAHWCRVVPVLDFLSQSLSVFTLLAGGLLVINGEITLGEMAMFNSLTWALSTPMKNISGLLNDVQRFFTSAEKVVELCEAAPLIADRPDAVAAKEKLEGRIEFRDVSFHYRRGSRREILDHVSFTIEPGQTVAIMGPTGSGKSTVSELIARFYDPTGGQVLLDGVDVRMRRLYDIHRAVAIATQDVFLFSDTIDGNIAFSDTSMPEENVYRYATMAAADHFIRRSENGYDTIIGERGVGLSGGQRQRIALARALAAEPSVLILDDTTSALDTDTETMIQQSLGELPYRATKIVIAGRISSVRDADVIYILENGKICSGTHEELAATNAFYRELCELQNVAGLPPFVGERTAKGGTH